MDTPRGLVVTALTPCARASLLLTPMVRFEVNDPVVVSQIGGRTLSGRVKSVNTDNSYTVQYDDGSRERVGEHLVQVRG